MKYNFSIEIITLRKDKQVKYGFLLNVNTNEGFVYNTRVSPSFPSNNDAFISASKLMVSKMEELKLKYKTN